MPESRPAHGKRLRHADDELIREVRHAAGNLVQRMHYWTVVIEDEAVAGRAAESLASLRSSLDSLYRLIVRSLDLVRATETRSMAISLGDFVAAVALRFGAAATAKLDADVSQSCGVIVDPLLLERALGLLGELLCAGDATNGRSRLVVDVTRDENAAPLAATISLGIACHAERSADPFAEVYAHVTSALALKLLDDLGIEATIDEHDHATTVRIALPLCEIDARRDRASTHRTSSRDSRENLPL